MCSDEGRDDCQQVKPKGSHASFITTVIAVAILLMRSIVFSRVTVNVFVFELGVVFFVTRYMYDARRRDFALSASHFSPRGRANSRLQMKKIKIFVTENTESESICMEGYSEKYTIVV